MYKRQYLEAAAPRLKCHESFKWPFISYTRLTLSKLSVATRRLTVSVFGKEINLLSDARVCVRANAYYNKQVNASYSPNKNVTKGYFMLKYPCLLYTSRCV